MPAPRAPPLPPSKLSQRECISMPLWRDKGHKGRLEEFGLMTPKEGGEQQTETAPLDFGWGDGH